MMKININNLAKTSISNLVNNWKKIITIYNQESKWIRFIIILFLTLWINFYLIPDLKIYSNSLEKVEYNNTTYIALGIFNLDQDDLNSGNLNSIFWKTVYLKGGRDKICFEKINRSNDNTFSASYNNGEVFNVTNKRCFYIPKEEDKVTFQVSYGFNFEIPSNLSLSSRRVVNKSECVWITSNETCITQDGIDNAVTWVFHPDGEVYLEANSFHKFTKLLFIFFSTGAVLWAFSRTFYLIKYGWDKKP